MARLATFALLFVHLTGPGSRPHQTAAQPLVAGAIERQLATDDRHTYRLDLDAGEFASVTLDQRAVDAKILVLDRDGNTSAEVQDNFTRTGTERAIVVADAAGPIILAVMPGQPRVTTGSYAIRVTERRAATAADRDLRDATVLRTQVTRLLEAQKTADALPLATRALALAERAAPPGDIAVALARRAVAEVQADRRSFKEAEAAYKGALAVFERVLGPADPLTAIARSRLAGIYGRLGQPLVAEQLAVAAIRAVEAALGPDHLAVAMCAVNLGSIRQDAGDVQEAEALTMRALAIAEKSGGSNRLLGAILNNLGVLALDRQNLDAADDFFRRSVKLGEPVYGADSNWMANALLNLGIVARQRKHYDQAEAYYLNALAIREKLVPPDHPDIASNLNNLATLYSSRGDPERSLATHRRALAIWEKAGGPYGSGTLMSLGNIARVYAASGDVANAVSFQRRADAALETQLALHLAIGSERQRLASATTIAARTDRTISLSLGVAAGEPGATALAALVLLQRKGRVLDAMSDTLLSFRQRSDAAAGDLVDQLGETTRNLARLALNGRQGMTAEEHRAAIAALEQKKERIESTISEHNAQFRARALPVTLEAIQASIPADAALLEYAVFRPFNPKAATNAEAYGAPHYAAYVIRREGTPRAFDLGAATEIDHAINTLRSALRDPRRRDVVPLARALEARVLAPLRPATGTAARLLVSPDGDLNLIPFEALVGDDGRYAIERYAISYLTSGRDLLRMAVARPSRGAPVIVANPAFGAPPPAPPPRRPNASPDQRNSPVNVAASLYFAPLTGTAQEAREIRALFPEATLLAGKAASKRGLAELRAPELLHIASHGFFLQDARVENPLLRSGLALAGANTASTTTSGGILTALEAANLDLWGTKLVTLSACDTGLGAVRNGEGVYGLRRAFVLAGAETLVMSLWPVSDYVTRQMMSAYYRGLKDGRGRGESLRAAQLAFLARANRRHPFYWASFIQAGDWSPLKGS